MASYAASVLATAQGTIGRKYNEAELRRKQRPAVSLAIKNQDFSIPDHEILKSADSRTAQVAYLTRRAAGSATAKVASHTGSKGDSAMVTLAYVRHVETFRTSRKQGQNNVVGLQAMFNNEMEQAIKNILDRHETSSISYLVTNRSQIAAPDTGNAGTWDATNFGLVIDIANKARFAQFAKSFMQARLYKGDLDMIADLTAYRELEFQAAQGAGNSVNTSALFAGLNILPTTDTILSAFADGSALIMPAGTFAGLNWNDPLNRKGVNSGDNNVGMLGTMLDPYGSGAIFDVSMYTARADESSASGNVQDIKDEWEVSLTIGYALPPLSTASDSPVHIVAQAAS